MCYFTFTAVQHTSRVTTFSLCKLFFKKRFFGQLHIDDEATLGS